MGPRGMSWDSFGFPAQITPGTLRGNPWDVMGCPDVVTGIGLRSGFIVVSHGKSWELMGTRGVFRGQYS